MNTLPNRANECQERYWGFGPAYEDIAEFARDEEIWVRKYLEAWHVSTENGNSDLQWLGGVTPHDRLYLDERHTVECKGLKRFFCKRFKECHEVNVA